MGVLLTIAIEIGMFNEYYDVIEEFRKAWERAEDQLNEWMFREAPSLILALADENRKMPVEDQYDSKCYWLGDDMSGLVVEKWSDRAKREQPAFIACYEAFQLKAADIVEPWLEPDFAAGLIACPQIEDDSGDVKNVRENIARTKQRIKILRDRARQDGNSCAPDRGHENA